MPGEAPNGRRRRRSPAVALAEVNRLLDRGDLLQAFDRATDLLSTLPDFEPLKHRGVLALVRAGATERAAQLFREWGLASSGNADVRALEARIAKDRALALTGEVRRTALRDAAELYRRIHETQPSHYPAINRATLLLLAGEPLEARRVAAEVLADPDVAKGADYWALASRAEAHLLIGQSEAARKDLVAAAASHNMGSGARSSTRRQLRLVLTELGTSAAEADDILLPLASPLVLHAASAGESAAAVSRAARDRMRQCLAELRPGAVFSSLDSAAAIAFAEEAVAAGAELTIVLSAADAATAEHSLAPAWRRRFRACCRKASRIVPVAEDASEDAAALKEYAARVAMGLALLRAQHLDGEAVQVLLGGTNDDRSAAKDWRTPSARRQVALDLGGSTGPQTGGEKTRQCCAVVFGDLPAFSTMPEKFLPVFWDQVMGAIGDVLGEAEDAVALKKTWGDAVHLVVPDARQAARLCLAVQSRLQAVDGSIIGRTDAPTMRIGAHYGPVFEGWDPVASHRTYYGRALSRAARIEPITPPGTVYVTEAFAAILLLESGDEFACTYVGQVPLAKGFGTFRMYALSARPGGR